MNYQTDSRPRAVFKAITQIACAVVILIAFGALAGWTLEIVWLRSLIRGLPQMMPIAACNFVLAAVSLWLVADEGAGATVENPGAKVSQTGMTVGLTDHTVLLAKEGSERPIDDRGAPIGDEAGDTIGAALVFRDITERCQAEARLRSAYDDLERRVAERTAELQAVNQSLQLEIAERRRAEVKLNEQADALRESEERYRQLFEQATDAIFVADADWIYIEVNPSACRLLDYERDKLIGKTVLDVIRPEAAGRLAQVKEIQLLGHEQRGEWEMRRKDGSYVWAEVSSHILPDGRCQAFAHDITQRKSAEAEREQLLEREQSLRARAEEANQLKDEFLANISHELRTPLNHILGWVTMLRAGKVPAEETPRILEIVERNARAQHKLIEGLLDVSSMITGEMELDAQQVELAPVVEAAVALARPTAEAKNISLQVVLDPRSTQVSGDPDRLRQVVWHLVSNAIKFTPTRGRVQVRLERINSHLEIVVSDTGCGIKPQFLPHVFERFRQADATTTRRHGGLGLGLAIVRRLVELHGGSVVAESPGEGQGATFRVKLPLGVAQSVREPQDHHPTIGAGLVIENLPRLDGLKVLLVDDEVDSLGLLAAILEPAGAETRQAGNLNEALALIEQWRPDLIVSDVAMAGGRGYELIREARRNERTTGRWTPAVALTAYVGVEDRRRALASGFQMHIAKPVEPAELVMALASLADGLGDRHND